MSVNYSRTQSYSRAEVASDVTNEAYFSGLTMVPYHSYPNKIRDDYSSATWRELKAVLEMTTTHLHTS